MDLFEKPSLKFVLFLAFSIMSVIPVLLLGWWVVDSARESEYKAVEEKHLLVAKNITLALSRYAQDTASILEHYSTMPLDELDESNNRLLRSQNITSIRVFNNNVEQLISIATENGSEPPPLTAAQLEAVIANAETDRTLFLPVQTNSNGQPTIIITPIVLDNSILIAEMETGYISQLQAQVKFGKLGHAAIVDQTGNVLAHPMPEWELQVKNISKVSAVKRMMNREIGVEEFYSPAKKADMISGFSFVQETGWGVMVPQPVSELEENIAFIKLATLGVGVLGIALAMLISWFLAKKMARPSQELAELANHFEVNEMQPAPEPVRSYTREQYELSLSFHNMTHALQDKNSELLYQSQHDPLTGLANRNLLKKYLQEKINKQESFIFALLDLNDFKDVNDHWSHAHGDELLQHVANRLIDAMSKKGLVSRIGGDEFAIVFNADVTKEKAESLVELLRGRLKQSYQVIQDTLSIDCCCGLSCYPQDAKNRSDLMKCADLAMYAAKKENNTTFQWYQPQMRADLNERVELTHILGEAIKKNEFIIHYQPIIDVNNYSIQGFEALVRWQHLTKGVIPPGQFIPLAENSGQIIPLGELILDSVCKDISLWNQQVGTSVPIAVNLSVRQFDDPDLAKKIEETISRYKIVPGNVEFEITESLFAENSFQIQDLLNKIIDIGCKFSIDDFGTNQSSLSRLKNFEFHRIKIDKSFITELNSNEKAERILASIVNIGKTLKMSVIIEGVETQDQLHVVQALGCNYIQGFLFSPGVNFEAATRLLKNKTINPGDMKG
ncbi:bifunctional diguanylate cyclase/phosphodiesterase [Solemya velum gill symbiont]|uniref:bifunctional diguanylate cyclase/phosphodiesterase n=4 Tax=Solemya velum gill symbiont TaxID=2340 RepID=UPI00099734F5|nr:EAL domain-containing protein [Solemya velum gill symbiont]OOY56346.1 hypothetical protein BOV99_04870 [Solemya velum gill symbiont]OOY57935.1 hypothetical protein BOW00_05085 [Solemya velum gill symbiont]OOY60474.1 hypothetical protein BOW02_05640 [Solemya velum gill symbiont]OOY65265.1 hypothetical protein BOW05_05770 [Solemya velum gill symbiont]OOY67535.1 hypothetical protein BOW06_06270 [Solemya velum gill symbiont]